MNRTIAITLGEPLGVGPELVLRTLAKTDLPSHISVNVFGSPRLLTATAGRLDLSRFWERSNSRITLVPCGPDPKEGVFDPSQRKERAQAVLASLDHAIDSCMKRESQALLTAPLDKSIVRSVLPNFQGHTGYLESQTQSTRAVMLMANEDIRVAMVTGHIPLSEVSAAVTREQLKAVICATAKGLHKHLGVDNPRLAVAALNPHAGETSLNPEEEHVFRPVIEELQKAGLRIEGPFPSDSLFSKARDGRWDALISPYHDQGLVAVKYNGFEQVVNITLGLPFLRTSPGHGVAYDCVGTNKLELGSFQRAFNMAITGRLDI